MTQKIAGGYNGKLLRVNLSKNSVSAEAIDELLCRRYIGGAGFVAYFLWKELKKGVDALGPDNKLIFALGPLTGLPLPGAARNCVGAKSPLTGGFAKSESGGFWGAELKRAGYDAIIVEGRAEKPVYLWIHDGNASIRDARHLWGKKTKETLEAIRAELDDKSIRAVLIGPAGENKVRFACMMNDLHDAVGRGGLGAVAGSKNLKAIAVRGHKAPPTAAPERIKEIRQWAIANMGPFLSEFGTGAADMEMFEAVGNLPVRNFRDGLFPEVKQIHGGVMKDTIRVGMEGCFACPVRCKKVVQFEEPYPVDPAYGGPEYETIAALGSNCGIGNVKAIAKGNELCGAYSLDTISTGSAIAFAMECFEKGLLSTEETGGIELRFGNDEAMLKVIELIAKRQGIGDLLAEGTARVAKKIGKGSEEFAIQVKGLDLGLHDPRLSAGLGLGFMVNPHGADHVCNVLDVVFLTEPVIKDMHPLGILEPMIPDDISPLKVAVVRLSQLKSIVQDCLVVCVFLPYNLEKYAELLAAATGWDTGVVELLRAAERILTLARLINIREGFTAADDKLPDRFFHPKTDGALSDKAVDPVKINKAKSYYYELMGWDPNTG
ncbi:MAG: aldehyde ferredoxin oxidoreductase family protein, partial [Dehalococcoidia bacterium]|nr:aldehyde ferredoxin oxidoreductase family protein [Dehalococcoidia bacterium]